METNLTVLHTGSHVRLVSPDMNGYWGRDKHPSEGDRGFVGTVISNTVETSDEFGDFEEREDNVPGGTVYSLSGRQLTDVCYTVRSPDGRELELMHHEVEEVCNDPISRFVRSFMIAAAIECLEYLGPNAAARCFLDAAGV